jgi:hypothetical protein
MCLFSQALISPCMEGNPRPHATSIVLFPSIIMSSSDLADYFSVLKLLLILLFIRFINRTTVMILIILFTFIMMYFLHILVRIT